MKHKKYKLKLRFFRNIIICVVALFIVARLLDIMPGFERDKTEGITNLVIGDEDITEELNNNILVDKNDENNIVYISYEDVKELFDESIIFDNEDNKLITTTRTKVATMELEEQYIVINGTLNSTLGTVKRIDGKIYIPISEMNLVYNIEVNYISETDTVTIDELSKKLVRATAAKDIKVKSKMRAFSKTLAEVSQGEQISYYQDEYNGWTKIKTNTGIVGYIKTSAITNQYEIRQDMIEEIGAKVISEEKTNGWMKIKDASLEESSLKEYGTRESMINTLVSFALSENAKGVIINSNLKDEYFIRFMIEFVPRMRELGIPVAIQTEEKNNTKDLKAIVDYIVE